MTPVGAQVNSITEIHLSVDSEHRQCPSTQLYFAQVLVSSSRPTNSLGEAVADQPLYDLVSSGQGETHSSADGGGQTARKR